MIKRKLNLAIFISFALHLFCFIGVEFNFNGDTFKYKLPRVHFLGEFLDRIDFSTLPVPGIIEMQEGISSGHDKDKKILYKSNPPALNRRMHLLKKNRHLFKKISRIKDSLPERDALSTLKLSQRSRLFVTIDPLNNPDGREGLFNEVNFIDGQKPALTYSAPEVKNIAVLSLDRQKSENLRRGVIVFRQRLSELFFYKKLPPSVVEAELETLSKGNILSVKKILSSGDLEVDLFVLKVMRRKLYSEGKRRTLHFRRIRINIGND